MSNRNNNPSIFFQHSALATLANSLSVCAALSNISKKIVFWDQVKQISSIHHGYLHYPFHKESASLALKAVSLSVFLALGTSLCAQEALAAEDGSEKTSQVIKIDQVSDTTDGTYGQTFYYLQDGNSGDKVLNYRVEGQDKIAQKWTQSLEGQIYIAAGFRSLLGGSGPDVSNTVRKEYLLALGQTIKTDETTKKQYVESDGKPYWLTTTGDSTGEELSSGTSSYTLNFTVAANATGTYKLFGGRADTFDPTDSLIEENSRGASNKNIVNITFEAPKEGEVAGMIMTRIVFGGRSAQKENWIAEEGYQTNYNQVLVTGTTLKGKKDWVFDANFSAKDYSPELISRSGVWGAEGYQADFNYVKVKDAVLTGAIEEARKYGLIGGRGFFSYRLNTREGTPQSAIANNNIVVAINSTIGLKNDYQSDDGLKEGMPFSVVGGLFSRYCKE